MSHSVTITRTTTTSSGTALFLNTGHLSTTPGLLKLAELILGAVCVGLSASVINQSYRVVYGYDGLLFFLITAVAFLIGTFCLLLSCLLSLASATMISKSIYEVVYHGLAFILYLAAGLCLVIQVNQHKRNYTTPNYDTLLAASILGLVLAGLYLLSTFLANRSYRGI